MTGFIEVCGDVVRWLGCLFLGHRPMTWREAIPEDRTLAAMFRQAAETGFVCKRCGKPLRGLDG